MTSVQRRSTSTRVAAGVGGGGLALWLGFQKTEKTTPCSTIMQTFFHGNPGNKNRKLRTFTSPIRTALTIWLELGL